MREQFHDTDRPLSAALTDTARSFTSETVSVRELMAHIGEQGLLMFCIFLIIPFLVPVSIPGVSTVFGLVITLIGVGVAANRVPWLPARLMEKRVSTAHLARAFDHGARLVARLERFLHPRWNVLTRSAGINRFNGLMIVLGGVLLMAPFGFVPFSNTLPGLAILFLAIGILERDGVFVFLGYLAIVATIVYFAALIAAAVAAGMGLRGLFLKG